MSAFFHKISRTDVRNFIALLYISCAMAFLFSLIFKEVPPSNKDIVNIIAGTLIGGVGVILSFFFGDKKGNSDSKEETIVEK